MSTAAQPQPEPARAYRTRDLRRWSANPTRLARRLVDEGKLREAAHGLYYAPIPTRFGPAPPPSEELLRAFLGGESFLVTGPPYWNALGLGSTTMFAVTLVYNTRRSGEFHPGGRRSCSTREVLVMRLLSEMFMLRALCNGTFQGNDRQCLLSIISALSDSCNSLIWGNRFPAYWISGRPTRTAGAGFGSHSGQIHVLKQGGA